MTRQLQVASHRTGRRQQCLELGVGVVNNEEKAQPRTRKVEEEEERCQRWQCTERGTRSWSKTRYSICSTQNILIILEFTMQHRYPNLLLLSVCQDQRALKNIHDRMAITQGSNTDRRSFIVQIFLLKNHTLNTKYTDGAAVSKTYQRVKKNYPCFFCKPLGSSFTKGKKSRPCMYGRRTSGITRPFATDGQQELRRYE